MVWPVLFLDTPGKIMEIKEALGKQLKEELLGTPRNSGAVGGENKIFKLNPKVENFNAS